jgi:hypothetical protein
MTLAIRFEIRQAREGIQGRHLGKCCRETIDLSGTYVFGRRNNFFSK